MTEPDDFGLSAAATLAHVGAQGRSVRHTSFWKTWMTAVMAHTPRLVSRDSSGGDPSDLSATHEFVSLGNVRIGCSLLTPGKGRARAGLVALHGYSTVPALAQASEEWRPLVDRGVAVLVLRVRGYPGSQADCEQLVRHAGAPDGGGGHWITHGLAVPLSDNGCGSEWVYAHAVADVVNGYRALRAMLGQPRVPIFLHGESVGAALAIVAASQLADVDEVSRLAIGLPSMGDWPWRLSRPESERGLGASGLVGGFIKDHRALEQEIAVSVRVLDAAVHARRVRGPVLCKLALRDDVVPAPTAAAVFNALGSDRSRKRRFVTRYGHFDGGIADMRRHAQFDRLVMEYLDPDVDVMARDWESDMDDAKTSRTPRDENPGKDGEPTLFGAEPLPSRDGDDALIAAYVSTGRTLDDLPYTPEFDRLFRAAASLTPGKNEREVLHKLHNLRKAGRLPRLGKPASNPPKIDEAAEAMLSGLVVKAVGSLGQRDQLPYTPQFDDLVAAFNQRAGQNLAQHDVWRLVAKIAK